MIGTRSGLVIAVIALMSMGKSVGAQNGGNNWKAAAALPSVGNGQQGIMANVRQQAGNSLTVRYRIPEIVLNDIQQDAGSEPRTRITLGNAPITGKAGEPVLPLIPVQFIIPPEREIDNVTVTPHEVRTVRLSHAVEYGATPVPLMKNAKVEKVNPKAEIYESNRPFPAKNNTLVSVQRKKGITIGIVNLYPVMYYPQNSTLEYCGECEITITFRPKTHDSERKTGLRSTRRDVKRLGVENPEVLEQYRDNAASEKGSVAPLDEQMLINPEESFQYVIITSEAMRDATTDVTLQDLIAFRQSQGLTATIKTIESILEEYDGADDPEKVRNFIIDAYANWETEYIILGGDVSIIPVRMLYDDGANLASDLYYQCLDGPFNGDGDGYWGEPNDGIDGGDVDLLAEVFVGRLSAETPEEMSNAVYKILAYEQDSDAEPYLQNSCILGEELGSQFGPGMFSYAYPYMCEIKNGSSAAGYTTVGFSANEAFNVDSLYDYFNTWSAGDLIEHINSDQYSLINHLGHANTDNVMKMSLDDADGLTNNKYLFAFSQGCFPGDMTVDCIAEHFTTSTRHGFFACVFNSHYGYGAYNEDIENMDGPSQRIHRQFWDAYFGEYIYNLGALLADAHEDNLWDINGDLIRWCIYETNLFGDPFTVIRGQTQGPRMVYRSVSIEDNGDGIINPGETVDLTLTLRNIGNSMASGVSARFSIIDPYVSVTSETVGFGDVQCCGVNAVAQSPATISITPDCPTPYTLPVTVEISDADENIWEESFSLTIYTSYTISGQVLTITGNTPLAGATVVIAGQMSGTAVTNSEGVYTFGAIDGDYTLSTNIEGYLPADPVSVTLPPAAQNVDLFVGRPIMSVDPISVAYTLEVDDSVEIPLTITNSGDLDLLVTPSVRASSVVLAKGTPQLIPGERITRSEERMSDGKSGNFTLSGGGMSLEGISLGVPQRVLYLNTVIRDGGPDQFASAMAELPDVETFDLLNGETSTPDLDYLLQYDAVIVASDYYWADPELLGNSLADYIDAGGNLLMLFGTFCSWGDWGIHGRIITEEYLPLVPEDIGEFSESQSFIEHRITEKVSFLSTYLPAASTSLQGDGVSLGTYNTGYLVGAYNSSKPVVAINAFPSDGAWQGDLIQMAGNALQWFAERNWMSMEGSNVQLTLAPGESTELPLKLRSVNMIGGEYTGEVRLTGNDPQQNGPVTVPVALTIDGDKSLTVAPTALDFGDLWLGLSDTLELTFSNEGTQRTTITEITSDNPLFTVAETLPLNVHAGKSVPVHVIFTPENLGTVSGTMTIVSDAEDNPSIIVTTGGTGTSGPQAQLEPTEMQFELEHNDEPADRTATLGNTGGDVLSYRTFIRQIQKPTYDYGTARAQRTLREKSMERMIYSQYNYRNEFALDHVIVAFIEGQTTFSDPSLSTQLGNGNLIELATARIPEKGIRAYSGKKLAVFPLNSTSREGVLEAIKKLRDDINVAYVEPDYRIQLTGVPDDPLFSEQWALNNSGQTGGTADADIDAPEGWDNFTGENSKVILGMIDSGIDYLHPDLAANIWTNEGEIPDNGIDDDNNGYIDDIHGYDFGDDDNDPMDEYGHGTHCSGIAAACGNDNTGICGVSWGAKLMALRLGNGDVSEEIFVSYAINAITYANAMGVTITSNSWGVPSYSQSLYDVIAVSGLFVAAAGNNGSDADNYPLYPAAFDLDNIVSVAATDHNDSLANFSNYGLTTVDLAAPGVDILSSIPGAEYSTASGTSMATPHVAGCALLLKGYNSGVTSAELKEAILASADPLASLDGRCVTGGRLNVQKALNTIAPPWITLAPMTPGSVAPGSIDDFTVTVDPAQMIAGTWVAEVVYETDDPYTPEQIITVLADITPCRIISTGSESYDFGTVWIGRDSVVQIRVNNTCNAPITVSSLAFSKSEFASDIEMPLMVKPFGTADIPIRFTPGTAGAHNATLTINSDADNNTALTVELQATAVTPPNVTVSPMTIDRTLTYEVMEQIPVTLTNTGGADFHFSVKTVKPPEEPTTGLGDAVVFISQDYGTIRQLDLATGEIIADIITMDGSDFDGLAYDGEFLYYTDYTNEVRVIDIESGTVVNTITCQTSSGIDGIGITRDYLLLGNYSQGIMHVCNRETGELVYEWTADGLLGGVACSESRNSVFYFNMYNNQIEERAVVDGTLLNEISFNNGSIFGLAYSEEASALIAASPGDGIFVLNPDDGSTIISFPVYDVFAVAGDELISALEWLTADVKEGIVPAGGALTVHAAFNTASMLPGDYNGILRFEHAVPYQPGPFDVNCQLTVLPESRCSVSPDHLAFTDTWLGRTDTLIFWALNTGNAATVVSSIMSDHEWFAPLSETSFSIPPLDSVAVAVGFTPQKNKTVKGELTIVSDADKDPEVTVSLVGSAVKPPVIKYTPDHLKRIMLPGKERTSTITLKNKGGTEYRFSVEVRSTEDGSLGTGQLYGLSYQELHTLDPMTGEILGSIPVDLYYSSIAFDGKMLYAINDDYVSIVVVDPETGARTDTIQVNLGGKSELMDIGVDKQYIYMTGYTDTGFIVNVLNKTDGTVVYSWALDDWWYESICAGREANTFYLLNMMNSVLELRSAETGEIISELPVTASGYQVTYSRSLDLIYFCDGYQHSLINPETGEIVGQFTTNEYIRLAADEAAGVSWLSTAVSSGVVEVNKKFNLDCIFDSERMLPGKYKAEVVVTHENGRKPGPFVFPCELKVLPLKKLSVIPGTMDFGTVWVGSDSIQPVTLRNDGNSETTVYSVISPNDAFSIEPAAPFTVAPFSSLTVNGHFSPDRTGTFNGLTLIISNAIDLPLLLVKMSGNGVTPPEITVNPEQFSFQLPSGGTTTETLTLENGGLAEYSFHMRVRENSSQVTAAEPKLYIGTSQMIIELDPETFVQTGGPIPMDTIWIEGLAFDGEYLYVAADKGYPAVIYRIDIADPSVIETIETDIDGYISALGVTDEYLVAMNSSYEVIHLLNKTDGSTVRTIDTPEGYGALTAAADRNSYYIFSYYNWTIQEHDLEDGTLKNEFPVPPQIQFPGGAGYSTAGRLLYIAGEEGTIAAVNPDDGSVVLSGQTSFRGIYAVASDEAGALLKWLNLSINKGIVPGNGSTEVTVTVDAAELEAGSYSGEIAITPDVSSAPGPFMIPCDLSVSAEETASSLR